jgi:hypothetical protein
VVVVLLFCIQVDVELPCCCFLRDDCGPAERAVGGGLEPRVDAVDVEGVAAGRQLPEPLAVAEVGQAHGAVHVDALLPAAANLVAEGGYAANGGSLEATAAAWFFFSLALVVARDGVDVGAPEEEEAAAGEEEVVGEQEEGGAEDPHDGDAEDEDAGAAAGDGGLGVVHGN